MFKNQSDTDMTTGKHLVLVGSGLLVNKYLQCTAHPEIFGGGRCIYFKDRPLDKVGVYAVRQNPVLYQNLMASLEETVLQPFDPGGGITEYLIWEMIPEFCEKNGWCLAKGSLF